jgi:hypothetical protein
VSQFQLWAQPWWVNLLILIPLAAAFSFRRPGTLLGRRQLVAITLFAAAFGFVEASVVVYLRAATGLLPGYIGRLADVRRSQETYGTAQSISQIPQRVVTIEVYREAATMVMLATQDERTTSLHIENCVATIEEKQTPAFPMAAERVLVSDLETVNMAHIDPSRIKTEITASEAFGMLCNDPNLKLNCNQADIGLHTRNDHRVIKSKRIDEYPKLTGADHRSVSETMEDSAYLYVDDLEYLPRFVAALKREIELCGGKPSPF